MSNTDGGTRNRPGSGPGSDSGGSGSGPSGASGSTSSSGTATRPGPTPGSASGSTPSDEAKGSGDDTRPLKATGPSVKDAPSGAQKPAARPGQGKTATAVAVKDGKPVRPAKAAAPRPRPAGPVGRRVRLTVSRIDPWSAMKLSFLLSVALGIAFVVMAFVLWTVLNSMGVFDQINNIAANLFPVDEGDPFDLMDYIGLGKVMSLAIVVGVIDVILITAIATLSAFLYNLSSSLGGGLQLTLTDD